MSNNIKHIHHYYVISSVLNKHRSLVVNAFIVELQNVDRGSIEDFRHYCHLFVKRYFKANLSYLFTRYDSSTVNSTMWELSFKLLYPLFRD